MNSQSIKRRCSMLAVQGTLALSRRCWLDAETLEGAMVELGTCFEMYDAEEAFFAKPADEQFALLLNDLKLPDPQPDPNSALGGLGMEDLLWVWLSYHTGLLACVLAATTWDEDDLSGTLFSANQISMALLATAIPGRHVQ